MKGVLNDLLKEETLLVGAKISLLCGQEGYSVIKECACLTGARTGVQILRTHVTGGRVRIPRASWLVRIPGIGQLQVQQETVSENHMESD